MRKDRPRLLIFDGHGSHTTLDIIRHCIHNRIHLALLPPHTSHLTQPLDVGVFSSLKAHMAHEMDRYFRAEIPRMQKAEWLDAFILAQAKAFTQRNILSGWRGTGLNPFNPRKVLSRIPIPSPLDVPVREATPQFESPLQHPDLTSSPINTPVLQAANTDIKKRALGRNTEFDTPARNHVVRMVRTLDRSFARNGILSKQFSDLGNIVSTRKQRQSGKHAILRGQTIIATPENFERLQKAEQETKVRSPKQQKTTHPSAPSPHPTNPPINMDSGDLNSDEG